MIKEIIRPDHCIRICDNCGESKKVSYWNIKNKENHLCRTCSNQKSGRGKIGYRPWNLGKTYQKPSGNSYINRQGYNLYYIGDKSYKGGYVSEHRIIVELHIGRRLAKNEKIHHIDGDKSNNDLSNLVICNGHSEHRLVHNNLEKISMNLVKLGIIKFNKENKEYFIDKNIIDNISKIIEFTKNFNQDNKKQNLRLIDMSNEECSNTIRKWSMLT